MRVRFPSRYVPKSFAWVMGIGIPRWSRANGLWVRGPLHAPILANLQDKREKSALFKVAMIGNIPDTVASC